VVVVVVEDGMIVVVEDAAVVVVVVEVAVVAVVLLPNAVVDDELDPAELACLLIKTKLSYESTAATPPAKLPIRNHASAAAPKADPPKRANLISARSKRVTGTNQRTKTSVRRKVPRMNVKVSTEENDGLQAQVLRNLYVCLLVIQDGRCWTDS
jgi:hypothetical protein